MKYALVMGIVFQAIILSWILKLEKTGCSCSTDWRRDFIKYYSIFGMAIASLLLARPQLFKQYMKISPALLPLYLTYLYAVLTFIPGLWRHQCDCATQGDWRDDFIFWWIGIGLIFQMLGLVFLAAKGR